MVDISNQLYNGIINQLITGGAPSCMYVRSSRDFHGLFLWQDVLYDL